MLLLLSTLLRTLPPYASAIQARLNVPDMVQVCSDLTRLECRVRPVRDKEDALLAAYDSYFDEIITSVIPLARPVIDTATELRARYGFRTPDAIHLAAAIVDGCDLFLTNDHRLERCTEIAVEVM